MPTNFVQELQWRGLLHDIMPETETFLLEKSSRGYIGFDPTADSLHIGSLVQIMILMHFQRAGHKPMALVGGATGMVGDPSGKSNERNLLDLETLRHNQECQKAQLQKFLDFNCGDNSAVLVNNYDWFKDFGFLDFIREAGKHITVNYMMAKDSVKNRISSESTSDGMSFTEFTYQLFQGYDFYHLYKEKNCVLQMGGSDQWGNIVTGTELIRRKVQGEAFALTIPLITKADGGKFGKTEQQCNNGDVSIDWLQNANINTQNRAYQREKVSNENWQQNIMRTVLVDSYAGLCHYEVSITVSNGSMQVDERHGNINRMHA